MHNHDAQGYWKATLGLITKVMVIWFLCSFGAGILFADALNSIKLGGYPLGFWFAQQGSIASFVVLVLAYCVVMNRVDRRHHEELSRIRGGEARSVAP